MIDAANVENLGNLVREAANRYGSRTIFRFEGASLSFLELDERSNQLAHVLESLGIKHGDRVAVMLPNGFEFPITWLAIAKLGAVMVPVNVQYQHDDLRYVLRDSGAKLIVTAGEFFRLVARVKPECPMLETITGFDIDGAFNLRGAMGVAASTAPKTNVARGDLVNLQYTSGTTGFPKGCMLTHAYWLELGTRTSESLKVQPDDVNFTVQPFYYMDPQWNAALCLITGIPLVIAARFSASRFWKTIHDERVTFFYCLGTIPVFLLKQPENPALEQGHKLRLVSCSGIVPQFHALFEQRFAVPWREGFGMTETGVDLIVPLEESDCVGSGRIGKPVKGKEARIVDANDEPVRDGETGELVVRGGAIMLGYWNNPEASARALRGGWMHTGDLAYKDANGNYFLVGRLKDMIRRGSENIASSEVEAVICEHEAVAMAAIVPVKDEMRGEEVKAFVQLREGQALEPNVLLEFLSSKLAKFKLPRYIAFVNSFPLTPSDKIAKHKLNDLEYTQLSTFDLLENGRNV